MLRAMICSLLVSSTTLCLAAGQVVAKPRILTLGRVAQGEDKIAKFTLENTSDRAIAIERYQKSCACTSVTPAAPMVIQPKSYITIEIVISTQHLIGAQDLAVYIHTNETGSKPLLVKLKLHVQVLLSVFPERLSFIVANQKDVQKRVFIHKRDSRDLKIVVGSAPEWTSVALTTIEEYIVATVTVKSGMTHERGEMYGSGTIVLNTNKEAVPRIAIPVRYTVDTGIYPVPRSLFLDVRRQPLQMTLMLELRLRPDVKYLKLSLPDGWSVEGGFPRFRLTHSNNLSVGAIQRNVLSISAIDSTGVVLKTSIPLVVSS